MNAILDRLDQFRSACRGFWRSDASAYALCVAAPAVIYGLGLALPAQPTKAAAAADAVQTELLDEDPMENVVGVLDRHAALDSEFDARDHASGDVSLPLAWREDRETVDGDEPEPAEAVAPIADFTLTAISGGRAPVAMIDGRPRTVGDVISDGWRIETIDAATRTVRLTHRVAGSQTLRLGGGLD